jgi:hypothetical protein
MTILLSLRYSCSIFRPEFRETVKFVCNRCVPTSLLNLEMRWMLCKLIFSVPIGNSDWLRWFFMSIFIDCHTSTFPVCKGVRFILPLTRYLGKITLLALCFAFAVYIQLRLMLTLFPFTANHYMFLSNWPSSSVQVVVLNESAVLLSFDNCLGLMSVSCYCHALQFTCNERLVILEFFSTFMCMSILSLHTGC